MPIIFKKDISFKQGEKKIESLELLDTNNYRLLSVVEGDSLIHSIYSK